MLLYRRTSILESSAQTLVNTVNCVGVMGKGLAKEFKVREPRMFDVYKRLCEDELLEPGKLWLWKSEDHWVLNFPTKVHWRNPSRLEWVEAGLAKFVSAYEQQGIREISFPRLGCGNGGLDWNDVRPLMEHYLGDLPIPVYIHDYSHDIGIPEHLEALVSKLEAEEAPQVSFDGFVKTLKRLVKLSNGHLADLETSRALEVNVNDDDGLSIVSGNTEWQFERDDLRGVWLRLQQGILTKERASWAAEGGGTSLISVLGLMPQLRPIEIQRFGESGPELAVELKPRGKKTAVAQPRSPQAEFAWH